MRSEPIKHPRRIGEHVEKALDFLKANGAEEIRVYKTKHIIIAFRVGRHELEVRTACTPRDDHHAHAYLMQEIRRVVERAWEAAR